MCLTEDRVRGLLLKLTGWIFPKARPAWLKGRSRVPLELDGFAATQRVAFEYQGVVHYLPIFGKRVLKRVKRNDARKRQLCRRHGVYLICIPYWKTDIETFLRKKLGDRVCTHTGLSR